MGDIIVNLKVKSDTSSRARWTKTYFDSGSPYTFIAHDLARKLDGLMLLPKARVFNGLGNGKFKSLAVVQIWFNLLGIWCSQLSYVTDRKVITQDILAGHDFMQHYNIRLDPRNRKIILDRQSIKQAQIVR